MDEAYMKALCIRSHSDFLKDLRGCAASLRGPFRGHGDLL